MLTKEPSPERATLGFKEAVLSSFEFLKEFGLRPVEESVTFVRYESSEVFVNVYHGRASFELGVEIGRLKDPIEKLTVYDIVAWAGAEKTEGFGQQVMFQVSSREGVQDFLPKLAHLVRKHGAPFLRGDPAAYYSALEARSRSAVEYAKQVNLRSARNTAETAWHAKDYAQVVELYGPMRDDLTVVEAKRLAYAEQQALTADGATTRSSVRKKAGGPP